MCLTTIKNDFNKLNEQVETIKACIYVNLRKIEDKNITDGKCIEDKVFKKETYNKSYQLILILTDIDLHINEEKLLNYKKIKKLIKKTRSKMEKINKFSNKIQPKKMLKKISPIKSDLKTLENLLKKEMESR